MRDNPDYALENTDAVADLVRENPWTTFVSYVPGSGLIASHYPVLLDEEEYAADRRIVLLSHMGRPDEEKHDLGRHDVLAIVEGPHGYISPSWYGYRPNVPTWDFAVAHLRGTVELLSGEANLEVLDRLVEHFEKDLPNPHLLHATKENSDYAARIVHGTVGFRLNVASFEAKEKMNQDKPVESIRSIIDELRAPGPHHNLRLAARIAAVNHLDI